MPCAASRWSARDYLRHWQPSLFPPYFDSLLHPFFASLLPLDTDARVEAVRRVFPEVRANGAARRGSSRSFQTWENCSPVVLSMDICNLPIELSSSKSDCKGQVILQVLNGRRCTTLLAAHEGLRCLSCTALLCRYELLLRRRQQQQRRRQQQRQRHRQRRVLTARWL